MSNISLIGRIIEIAFMLLVLAGVIYALLSVENPYSKCWKSGGTMVQGYRGMHCVK